MKEYKLNPHNFYLELDSITQEEFENLLNVLEKNGKNVSVAKTWNKSSWKYLSIDAFNTDDVVLSNILSRIKIKTTYQQVLCMYTSKLKIGDTFEKDGFICRVVEEIDHGKWYKVSTKRKTFFEKMTQKKINSFHCANIEEITDQEFINQLEKHIR